MESKTFQVPSIGCAGCTRTIQSEVSQLAGVKSVEADVASKMVTIQWESPATWQIISDKLVEIDYAPLMA
jgi:copper chaperone CopZ